MFRKDLIKAFKDIKSEKHTSLINILGLSIGIVCFILIFIWVTDELSYERGFTNSGNLYRVNFKFKLQGEEQYMASCPGMLAEVVKDEIPEVEVATRVFQFGDYAVSYQENHLRLRGAFVNANFFDVFSFRVISGDPSHLAARNKIVLTESAAKRLLGDDAEIGRFVTEPDQSPDPFEVVAIIEDNTDKSHIYFDILFSQISMDWMFLNNSWFDNLPYTYIKINENTRPEAVESKFPAIIKKYVEPILNNFSGQNLEEYYAAGNEYKFLLQPVLDVHLKSDLENEIEAGGNILYVKLFSMPGR